MKKFKQCRLCKENTNASLNFTGSVNGEVYYWVQCSCGVHAGEFNNPTDAILDWGIDDNNGTIGTLSISKLQQLIHQQNKEAGWWDSPREKGTLLCLIHSEISEAMEGERKDLMDDHLPHRKMAEVELADAVIRILDYAEAFDYDIAGAIQEKLEYNKHRSDHKAENRNKEHGKKF